MKIRGGLAAKVRASRDQWLSSWLASLGRTHADRSRAIASIYEERSSTARAQSMWLFDGAAGAGNYVVEQGYCTFTVARSIATMDTREREHLRLLDLLVSASDGTDLGSWDIRAALIWGDGKATLEHVEIGPPLTWKNMPDRSGMDFLRRNLMTTDRAVNWVQQKIAHLDGLPNLDDRLRAIVDDARELTSPGGSGSWLRPADVATSVFAPTTRQALLLGTFPDGTPLTYSGDGSLMTIAPPGSGKTQCNVLPNLLTWAGAAVVLDVSGELYEATAGWRSSAVGPVFRFAPLEPEASNRYNPLSFVRADPDYIWEDARLLAELMIVPTMASDPFWENEARTVLTAAIAYVCYTHKPDARPLHEMLDVLFGGEAWNAMIRGLQMAVDVRVMKQHATSLSEMNERTRSSVLQVARSSLSAWTGERIARVTAASDWNPQDLRSTPPPTIYICVRPHEVESYLSLLRVFIGQHIRVLTSGAVPPHDAQSILFMLDELPRLRFMAPVDEALNIGRKYSLKLWMFAQSTGQIKESYPNADGMVASSAVRIYMNPSGADGMAERIADELGYVDSINDGSRRRLVDPAELTGPAYRDKQIVFGVGSKPARIDKRFAWQEPGLMSRSSMGVRS